MGVVPVTEVRPRLPAGCRRRRKGAGGGFLAVDHPIRARIAQGPGDGGHGTMRQGAGDGGHGTMRQGAGDGGGIPEGGDRGAALGRTRSPSTGPEGPDGS